MHLWSVGQFPVIHFGWVQRQTHPKWMTGIGQLTRGAFRVKDLLWNPHFNWIFASCNITVKGTSNPEDTSTDVLSKLGPRVIRLQEPISLFSVYRIMLRFLGKKIIRWKKWKVINFVSIYFQICVLKWSFTRTFPRNQDATLNYVCTHFYKILLVLKYLIDPESKRCKETLKLPNIGKDASNLASFYGSHIDGIIYVK